MTNNNNNLDVDIYTLIDRYTVPQDPTGYYSKSRIWIVDIFDKLSYAEIMELKKRLWEFSNTNVLFDAIHMLELARMIERLESRIKDLELHNELEGTDDI